eukprot:scaffold5728_cov72-Phaeocystis_antarctica.AAC.2
MEAWSRFSFTGLDEVELLADELFEAGSLYRQLRATLARRRASRSRFTWLCLYEVELLGDLEAERLRDVWGSLSSVFGPGLKTKQISGAPPLYSRKAVELSSLALQRATMH